MFALTKGSAAGARDAASTALVDVVVESRGAQRGSASATLEDVSVEFELGKPVIANLSLPIAPGESVSIVGPSGGGKSTLLNLFAGLLRPTRGRVLFDGAPVKGPGPDRAVVFQDAALFPWLTLADNIAFPLQVAGLGRSEIAERVDTLLRLVHLSRARGAFPHELSGGMRQRGAIARALAMRPRMMLFDEPFAALDGQMRELLQAEVEHLVRGSLTTMVFVTHQVDEAVRLGDRVVVIGGRPGGVLADVRVDLPRPRAADDPVAARIARGIARDIRAEVEKIAEEEAG